MNDIPIKKMMNNIITNLYSIRATREIEIYKLFHSISLSSKKGLSEISSRGAPETSEGAVPPGAHP